WEADMTRKILLLILAVLALPAALALAHPMGNFSVSHYTALRIERDVVHIRYHIDIAKIPTFQEMSSLDTNQDKKISAEEHRNYLARQAEALTRGQRLLIDGQPMAMSLASSDLTVRPGAGGLPTLFLTINYRIPFTSSSPD